MSDDATPAKVRLTDVLGPTLPKRDKVEALMKRCQIGVGGRRALDDAHDIMAECYGALGALMLAVETLHAETVALRAMYEEADAESDALAREAHTWSKAAEHYAKPLEPLSREQIDAVMTEHYPLSSLLCEEVDAFERCVRDIERLHGIGGEHG